MLRLNNVATTNAYTPENTLASERGGGKLVLLVANASVLVQLRPLWDKASAAAQFSEEDILLTPGFYDWTQISGLRVKSAVAGTPARVIAQLYEPGDVVGGTGTAFSQTLLASGGTSPAVTGSLLRVTLLTAAAGNHVVGADCNSILLRLVAGGGAGGGTPNDAANRLAGGGGGAGGYEELYISATPSASYAYVCGAAGTPAAGANGGDGGDSTFTVGATTVTAKGGKGGILGVANGSALGGDGGAQGTSGTINGAGAPGMWGTSVAAAGCMSGFGGSSLFGCGGNSKRQAAAGQAAGAAGVGFGAGGGGSVSNATAGALAGGAGTPGCILVYEYG